MIKKIVILVLLGTVIAAVLFYDARWYGKSAIIIPKVATPRCLEDTERAMYEVIEAGRPGRVRVSVVDVVASTTVWSREISHPTPDIVDPVKIGNCAFYAPQSFNYDWTTGQMLPDYSFEIWRFPLFSDTGTSIVITSQSEGGVTSDRKRYYSGTTFSLDPDEKYIVLERGYFDQSDYALVIKDLATNEDVLELKLEDIIAQHPSTAGSFSTGKWYETPDGVYLDSDTFDGSRIGAQIFIKRDTWEVEILPTPEDYLPGVERRAYPLSPYWAYTDVVVWTGLDVMDEIVIEDAIAEGQEKSLIVANLRTGEKTIVETVPIVPEHRFDLTWLSMTELEYTMPDGETKTYRVAE